MTNSRDVAGMRQTKKDSTQVAGFHGPQPSVLRDRVNVEVHLKNAASQTCELSAAFHFQVLAGLFRPELSAAFNFRFLPGIFWTA